MSVSFSAWQNGKWLGASWGITHGQAVGDNQLVAVAGKDVFHAKVRRCPCLNGDVVHAPSNSSTKNSHNPRAGDNDGVASD
jgi:hypothetical protein